MKTIKVTDEMYNSLIELSKEMNNGENLCTAKPVLFFVQTSQELCTCEGRGTEIWVDDDCNELRTKQDILDCITDDLYENRNRSISFSKAFALRIVNNIHLDIHLESLGFRKINVEEVQFLDNPFFTRKQCHQHIRRNRRKLRNPVCYASHASNNPEMELVSKFLYSLTNNELSK